jgi:hypothetical protein
MPADCSQSTLELWLHAYATGKALDELREITDILASIDRQIADVQSIATRDDFPEFCAYPTYGRQVIDVIERCRAGVFSYLVVEDRAAVA